MVHERAPQLCFEPDFGLILAFSQCGSHPAVNKERKGRVREKASKTGILRRAPAREALRGGDLRSIGRANDMATAAAEDATVFAELIAGLDHTDRIMRMRCADAAEKASSHKPKLLRPYKKRLLRLAAEATAKEMRWHFALMLPRLSLTARERVGAVATLETYLSDSSRIVVVNAMQALAEFARDDEALRVGLVPRLARLRGEGSPAIKARARKLLRAGSFLMESRATPLKT